MLPIDNKFFLSAKEIHAVLEEKKVPFLFHANTLLTALTFIENNALLSRSFVERNGLQQTPQKSDAKDIEYNVWDDVFFDGADLHKKYRNANFYGPILFMITLDLLLSDNAMTVLVTKKNPLYWRANDTWDNRYYSNLAQIKDDYLTNKKLDSQIMFTLRSIDKMARLDTYLAGIGVDRPNIIVKLKSGGIKNVGEFALGKIQAAINQHGLNTVPLMYRHVNDKKWCSCGIQYFQLFNNNFPEFKKRFSATLD